MRIDWGNEREKRHYRSNADTKTEAIIERERKYGLVCVHISFAKSAHPSGLDQSIRI